MKENRIGYLVTAVVALALAGIVYAWSVLSQPIGTQFSDWSRTELSFTFTLSMACFCLGGLVGGFVDKKLSLRIRLYLAGALFFLGTLISSRMNSLAMLYLGYGVIMGFASGFAYNAILSSVSKWFPNNVGAVSGILLMGFATGSFVIGKLYQGIISTSTDLEIWRQCFFIFGIIVLAVFLFAGSYIKLPPAEFLKKSGTKVSQSRDFTPAEVLKDKNAIFIYLWAIVMSAAGLAFISQVGNMALEISPSLAASTVSTVAGLVSIFNGIGRVNTGIIYDKCGYKKTMVMVFALYIIATAALIVSVFSKNFVIFTAGTIVLGLAYGGVTPMISATTNDFFGSKFYSINLAILTSNLLIASFSGTIAGMLFDNSGSYLSTLIMMLIAVTIGFVLCIFIKKEK